MGREGKGWKFGGQTYAVESYGWGVATGRAVVRAARAMSAVVVICKFDGMGLVR